MFNHKQIRENSSFTDSNENEMEYLDSSANTNKT